jgi:hypothetical protein
MKETYTYDELYGTLEAKVKMIQKEFILLSTVDTTNSTVGCFNMDGICIIKKNVKEKE